MPRPRKSASSRKSGDRYSGLVEKLEKLAAALEGDAAHKRVHPFTSLKSWRDEIEFDRKRAEAA